MELPSFKKIVRVLAAMAVFACGSALLCAPKAQGAMGSFSIEQVYVNVPELDVFVRATDANGDPVSPSVLNAAGVEVYLGDETLPKGSIGVSTEPVCYILAVDNSVSEETLRNYRTALRGLVNAKGEDSQIMLYALAGDDTQTGAVCALSATSNGTAAHRAVNALRSRKDAAIDLTQAAARIYSDINANYQSIAPRKVLYVLTDAGETVSSAALLGALASNAADSLNMPTVFFASVDDATLITELSRELTGDRVRLVHESELGDAIDEQRKTLENVLEIRTTVTDSHYGERLEMLTLSVPELGSAVKTTSTVYMGHKLEKPAVQSVRVLGRGTLELTFNQAVDHAEDPARYRVQSEDIWSWNVRIKSVSLSTDGMTATLYTEPLYAGNYTVKLRKLPSAITAANVSDSGTVFRFSVEDWPRDQAFYLARFRIAAALGGAVILALALAAFLRVRRDRRQERQAEAEHLLAEEAPAPRALPGRWITLYLSTRRGIAETRWSAYVESSLIVGSEAAACDLCLNDGRTRRQHAVLALQGDRVLVQPLDGAPVSVNGEPIGGEYRLQNGDVIKIGRTMLRLVL